MSELREGLLRSLAFFDVIGSMPTFVEWMRSFMGASREAVDALEKEARALVTEGLVVEDCGRVRLARSSTVFHTEESDRVMPRKQRQLRRACAWIRRVPGVRAIFVCNSMGFLHPTEESDIDLFILTRAGMIWMVRAIATLPFIALRLRPGDRSTDRDAICLSFFLSDRALNLSSLMIPRDVYMVQWFRSLIPVYDDGIVEEFWEANKEIRSRIPRAERWIYKKTRSWNMDWMRCLEPLARFLQQRYLPRTLTPQDTSVVMTDDVLKFHTNDARTSFRDRYEALCQTLGIRA